MIEVMFNVAHIKTCTEVEGPFRRVAIWFQGCDMDCAGCCNPALKPIIRKHLVTFDELLKIIEKSKIENDIEGVTFLGGEPTLQKNLPDLCKILKKRDIGTILFTGHLAENIDPKLYGNVDMIIDGIFDKNLMDDSRNMIGSSNQRIIDVSGRYMKMIPWFTDKRVKRIEIETDCDNIYINGDVVL